MVLHLPEEQGGEEQEQHRLLSAGGESTPKSPTLPPSLPPQEERRKLHHQTNLMQPSMPSRTDACVWISVREGMEGCIRVAPCVYEYEGPPLGKRYRNGMWERLCVIWVFVYLFIYLLVVECFQESLQHRYSCCSACLSGIQKAEGGMGGRDDTVFWLRQKERGGRERDGGGTETGLHGNTIRQTGDARRQTSKQGRQVDR